MNQQVKPKTRRRQKEIKLIIFFLKLNWSLNQFEISKFLWLLINIWTSNLVHVWSLIWTLCKIHAFNRYKFVSLGSLSLMMIWIFWNMLLSFINTNIHYEFLSFVTYIQNVSIKFQVDFLKLLKKTSFENLLLVLVFG